VITTHRNRYRVTTPDGFLVAICESLEAAERLDALLAERRVQVNVSVPRPLYELTVEAAERHGVSASSLALSLLQSHVLGVRLEIAPRATGTAAQQPRKRKVRSDA
jgi:hypothetical protein